MTLYLVCLLAFGQDLAGLPALPRVHYSCPDISLTPDDPRLVEYIRIARGAGISGEFATESWVNAIVAACIKVKGSSIGINYSPWHHFYHIDPLTGLPLDYDPTDFGSDHKVELSTFRRKLAAIKGWIAGRVAVTAILLDSERFAVKATSQPEAVKWNKAITRKHTEAYRIARSIFPAARIEWFDRGAVYLHPDGDWRTAPYFALDEPGACYSTELYEVPVVSLWERYARTLQSAELHGVDCVVPWVSLAAGQKPSQGWLDNWDYPVLYSAMMGWQVNQVWDTAEIAVFYPSPFLSLNFAKHLSAYVKGATGPVEPMLLFRSGFYSLLARMTGPSGEVDLYDVAMYLRGDGAPVQ